MNNTDYKEAIGVHLGRTASGELMTPYEAPTKHDSSLLVAIPRKVNRDIINLNLNTIQGYDVWHAYEFSYLLPNNQPRTGILKIVFPYDSENMIESKSFKLYLNSFDFEQFKLREFENDDVIEIVIENELRNFVKSRVMVKFHPTTSIFVDDMPLFSYLKFNDDIPNFYNADDNYINDIDVSKENPNVLGTTYDVGYQTQLFYTANLRSACEITNQKDTGHCLIAMTSDKAFDNQEMAQYIFSLRNSQHFHENVTEIIFKTVYDKFNPGELLVANFYNRRGGLDIHPIRFTSYDYYKGILDDYTNARKLYKVNNQL